MPDSEDATKVWVAELETVDQGYTSVHTSQDGAIRRLHSIAQAWGLTEGDEPIAYFDLGEELDNHPDVLSYGICHLPLEE